MTTLTEWLKNLQLHAQIAPRSLNLGLFAGASAVVASVPLCATSVCAVPASARRLTRALSRASANLLGNTMVNDPISDFLVRLQNASRVNKGSVVLPYSAVKGAIAKVLEKEGYLSSVSKKNNMLVVELKYTDGPAISGVKRISKPSRRMYLGVRDIRPVKRGHGLLVLSTPKGVVTGKDAMVARVGGEALFEIW